MKQLNRLLVSLTLLLLISGSAYAQTCTCGGTVPNQVVTLTDKADTTWSITNLSRNGYCCAASGSDRCISFTVNVHPDVTEVGFNVISPAPPGGAFYQVNCGTPTSLGTKLCVSGMTTFCITFCKSGNDQPTYVISTSKGFTASADVILRAGSTCTGLMRVQGISEPSVTWTSIAPGALGAYNSFLSCLTGCDSTYVTPVTVAPGNPSYIDYRVCGTSIGCATGTYCDTVRIFTVPAMTVAITPPNPTICSAGGSVQLTATPTGGNAPYTYSWTGPSGFTSNVANPTVTVIGTYTVTVDDSSDCNPVSTNIVVGQSTTPTVTSSNTGTACSNQAQNHTITANVVGTTYSWSRAAVAGISNAAVSGQTANPITEALINTTTSPVNVTYLITPTAAGCVGSVFTRTVTVNPTPIVTNAANVSACSGTNPSIGLTATVASTFTWTVGTITGGITGASAGSGSTINQILTNPSSISNGTVQYIVTPTSVTGSCVGAPFTITVTVTPSPVITSPLTATSCSGVATNVALTASVPSSFAWTIGTITGGITGATASSGTPIAQVLTNPSNSTAGTVQYIVTPTSTTNTCAGTPSTITVTVNPTPVVTNASSYTICSGLSPNVALTASTTSSFTWTIGTVTGGITGASAGSGTTLNQTLTNPSTSVAGSVQYIVTPTSTSSWSCVGIPFTITINVNPTPVVTTPASISTCSGTNPSIALTASTPSSFSWTIGTINGGITGASAGSGATINQTLTNPSNTTAGSVQYIVTPVSTTGSCPGAPYTITVTVNPKPVILNPATRTICSNGDPNIVISSSVAGSISWTIGNITGGITGASAGSGGTINQTLVNPSNTTSGTVEYILTPTASTGGCVGDPYTITVTVFPTPVVTNTATASICNATSPNVALTASVPGSFIWSIGTITGGITGASAGSGTFLNQTLTNPSSTTAGTVQYLVTPISSAGCTGSPYTITITVNPTPVVTNPATLSICSATSPNIALTASTPSNFTWTIGTVSGGITGASAGSGSSINQTLTNPSNATAGSVQYIVTPTSTTGSCAGSPYTITVTVNPTPSITTTATASVCSGTSPNITLAATVASNFAWTIGTVTGGITGASAGSGATINQTLTNPSNSTAGTVQYIVTPTSTTGGCAGAPYTITVTVNPRPVITNAASVSICNNTSPNIALTATTPSNFSWTIGTVTGSIAGASAGSGSTINQTLTNPSNATAGSVQYIVTPTFSGGGCTGTPFTITITVNPTPAVTNPSTLSICNGVSPNITVTTTAPSSISWTIGTITGGITGASAGSGGTINQTLTNPSNATAGSVQYIITPTSTTGGCVGAPYTITVTVNPTPSVTNAAAVSICNGTATNITLGATAPSNFSWTIGTVNGGITGATAGSGAAINQTLTNPSSTTAGTVQYIVTPTSVTGSCPGAPYTITVTVNPTPLVTNNAAVSICNNTSPNIALTASAPSTFTWTIGTVTGSITGASAGAGTTINQTLTNPSNATAGTVQYRVTATSTTGSCPASSAYTITVTVNPTPVVTNGATLSICNATSPNIALTASAPSNFAWTIGTVTGGITGATAGTGATINQTLTNPSSATAGTVQYIITPTSVTGNCAGAPYTITVTVNPTPVVTNAAAASICTGSSTGITLTSSAPANFAWTVGNVNGGITGASAGSGTAINQTLNNPSNATAGSVEYIVTPTSTTGSCAGPAYTITVTVHPRPVVTNPATTAICSGTSPNILLAATAPSNFTWTIGTVTGSITGASAGSGSTINQTLSNPSNVSAGSVQYIVTPTSVTGGCAGTPYTITVTVNAVPVITNSTVATICSGGSTGITLASTAPSTFAWTIGTISGGITGASAGSGNTIAQTLTNPSTSTAGSVQYIITPTSIAGGCAGNPFTLTITVNPNPVVTNSPTAAICSGTSPNIALSATTASSFSWTIGNITGGITGAAAGSGSTINQTLTNPSNATAGTVEYLVTATSTSSWSCPGPVFTITVTVHPTPAVTNPNTLAICSGNNTNIVVTASAASSISWTVGTITGGITGASSGSGGTISQVLTNPSNATAGTVQYIVTPTSTTGGCAGAPYTITVTVNPRPSIINAPAVTICNGGNTNITLGTTVAGGIAWTIGNITGGITGATAGGGGTINQVLTNPSSSAAGTVEYVITPTSSAGCAGTPFTITVTVNPTPVVTNAATAAICHATSPNIPLTASVPSTFAWTIGNVNGSITGASAGSGSTINQTLSNPSNATAGSVEYIVTPTSTTGSCPGAPFTITVTVNPRPVVTNPATVAICNNTSPNISLTSSAPSNFSWTIGTISGGITGASAGTGSSINQVLTNPNNAVAGSVEYIVTPTSVTGNCAGAPFTITVTVNPTPTVTNTSAVAICSGTGPNITLVSTTPSTFTWTIGAVTGGITGATAGSGNVINQTLTNPGNATAGTVQYLVTATSTTGLCPASASYNITVTVNPTPVVTNAPSAAICSGTSPNIALTASSASTFAWTIGNITGSITGASAGSGSTLNQTLTNPGNATAGTVEYIVTPTSTSGCAGSPYTITITVNPRPAIINPNTASICSGGNTNIILSTTAAANISWTIGTITGGITGATAGGGGVIGQVLTNPSNTTAGSVEYIITPTSSVGACAGAPYTITVTVNPTPVVTNSPALTICHAAATNLPLTASAPSTFSWTIGAITGGITGASAGSGATLNQTLNNPGNSTPGTVEYIITPTSVTGSCAGAPFTITVTVNPRPDVTNPSALAICNNTSPNITLTSSTPSIFSWTVGTITGSITGATAGSGAVINETLTNPSTTTAGTVEYIVIPTSTTSWSCPGLPYTITVTVNPTPVVTNPATVAICNGTSPVISLAASVPSNFTWTIGTISGGITGATAGAGATINQVLNNPSTTTAGTIEYIVTPTSTTGNCVGAPYTITVTVNPTPGVTNPSSATICSGTSPNINLSASAASNFSWTIGAINGGITGASAGSGTTINQTLTNPSTATAGSVEYIVTPTSATGSCGGAPFSITVTVNPIPSMTTPPATSICNGGNPNITLTASTPSTFSWTVGNVTGSIGGAMPGTGTSISQVLTNPSTTTSGSVEYIVTPTSNLGCVGAPFTITATVTVFPTPAMTNAPTASMCSGTGANIALTATTPSTFIWTIGNITGGITGAVASAGNTINQILTNPGNAVAGSVEYIVTPTSIAGGCPGAPFTITVTVNPTPVVTNAPAAAICNGTSPNIALTASAPSVFAWTIGNITGGITGASAGTGSTLNQTLTNPGNATAGTVEYLVTPTSTTGSCAGAPFTITITVNPTPVVTNPATLAICNNANTNIALTSSTPSNFAWTIGTISGGITGATAGSGSSINQALTNPSNVTPGTVEYIITPTSTSGNCVGAPYTITVTVHPTPAVTNPSTLAICNNTSPNISLTATTASNFAWTIGAVSGGITGASAGSGSTINQVLTNPSNSTAGTVEYIVTPTSAAGSCAPATPFTITVTVHPTPVVTNGATLAICNNTSPNLTLTSSTPSTFAWTVGAITGSISGATAGSGTVLNQVLTNPSNATSGTVQYIITPTSTTGNCVAASPYTITITVHPTPAITNPATAAICSGTSPNITLTSTTASNFSWTVGTISGGITGATAGTGNLINQVLTNPSNATAGSVQYIVTPTSVAGNCGPVTPFTITVTVNPRPVVTNSATATICSGTSPNIALTSTTPASFSWTIGAINGGVTGASAGSGTSINQVLTNPGNATAGSVEYLVTPTSTTGACVSLAPYSIVVTVNATPIVTNPASVSICNGTSPNIALTASTPATFTWTIGAITGSISGASAGSGTTISQVLTNPSNTTAGTVQYLVTATSTTGSCPASSSYTITVTVNPTPSVTNSAAVSICHNTSPNIALTSSTPSSFAWTVGTVTGGITGASAGAGNSINQTLLNPSNATAGTVQYLVTATSTTGNCPATSAYTITVTVNPRPVVTNAATTAICTGTGPNIALTASAPSNFSWTIGAITGGITGASNGSGSLINQTLTNSSNVTSGTVEYIVTPVSVTGTCTGAPFTITVTVNPRPVVTNPPSVSICHNTSTNIALTSSTPSTFTWTIGSINGSISGASAGSGSTINQTLTNPSNAFAGSVQYIVTPTSTAGCAGTPFTITVTVNPTPVVTNPATVTICNGGSPMISLAASTPSSFTWTVGTVTGGITGATGGASNTINQVLNNPGNSTAGTVQYIVTPTSTTGSCAGAPFTITVTVQPTPAVTNPATATVCTGAAPNIALTASAPSNFSWTIGAIMGGITGASNGSGSLINQTLTNPSNSASGSVQYIITPTSVTGNCVGAPYTITVTVNPRPAVTTGSTATTCSGTNPSVNLTATTPSTFSWTIGTINGGITGASAGSGATINQVLTNPSNSTAGSVQYIVTPTSIAGSCAAASPYTITINVNPTPTVTSAATGGVCDNVPQNYLITSGVPGATFSWSRPAVAGVSNPSLTGQTTNPITEAINNTTASSVSVVYNIIPSANGCTGTPFDYTLTVYSTPNITSSATGVVCSSVPQNYLITSAVAGATFTWDRPAVAGISNAAVTGQTGNPITESLINTTTSPVNVVYVITPSATGCSTGAPFNYTVTVNPTPLVTSPNSYSICHNTPTGILLTSNVPATFSWTVGTVNGGITGASAGAGPSINQTLSNPSNSAAGTVQYIVTPVSSGGNCAGPAYSITVTVNPRPGVTTPVADTICNATSPNLALTASAPSNFAWTIGTITGGITGATAGSGNTISQVLTNPSNATAGTVEYIVTPTSTVGSCSGAPFTVTITVNPTPVITSPATAAICNGTAPNITLAATAPSNYAWIIGTITGSISGASAGSGPIINQTLTNPSNVTSGTVEYIITPTSSNGGCTGPADTITITVNPTPAVTNPAATAICSGTSPDITLASSTPSTFTWTLGTITGGITGASGGAGPMISQVLTNPNNTTAGSVQYIVSPTSATGSCGSASPFTITVTVNPRPVVTNTATATVCSGTSPNLTLTSSTPSNFTWTVGTVTGGITGASAGTGSLINQVLTNPSNATAGTVEYIVTPTSTTGACVSLLPYSITVTVNPTPAITNPSAASICSGENTNITLTSTAPSNFSWTIGTITGSITGAAPGTGNTINQVLSNPGNVSAGTVEYIVTPTSTTGVCGSAPYTITVTVNPRPVVTNTGSETICSATSPNITLTSSTPSSFTWTVGTITGGITGATGGAGSQINQILTNPGTATAGSVEYVITPTSTTGACVAVLPYTILVTVNPRPVLTTASTDTICSDGTTNIALTATTPSTFTWVVGSITGGITGGLPGSGNTISQTLSNPSNTNVGSIQYIVTPTSTTGACPGSTTYTVTVYVNPKPQMTPPAPVSICNGGNTNIPLTASVPSTFTWTIGTITGGITGASAGSGNVISQVLTNPSTTSSGSVEYIVTPTSSNGCVGAPFSIIATVTVFPTPIVTNSPTEFTCSGTSPNINLTASTPSTFAWTLGPVTGGVTGAAAGTGGTISQVLTNPSNAVSGTVQYIVTATSIAGGCPSPLDTITVTVYPRPQITSRLVDTICNNNPQNYLMTSTMTTGVTYNWSRPAIAGIANAPASGSNNPITEALDNTTASPINVPYTITATANGCTGPAFTYTLTVNPTPAVTSRPTDTICSGVALNYNILTAVTGSTLVWTRPAVPGISNPANSGNTPSITETLVNTTNAPVNVIYIITPVAHGCNLTPPFAYTVTVNPTPVATASNDGPKCAGSTLNLTATSDQVGSTFNWTGPAGFGSNSPTPSIPNVSAANAGDYFVTATLNGCSSIPVRTTVVVGNIPAIVDAGDPQTLCANNSVVALTGSVTVGTTTGIWSSTGSGVFTPDPTSLPNATYTPSAADLVAGSVTIRLTATNTGVCPVVFDETIITFTPAPTVYAGEDFDVCADTTIQLDGQVTGATGGAWTTSGSGIFAPSANALGVTYIPTVGERSGGPIQLILTSTGNGTGPGACNAVSDTIVVNIVPLPVVNAGPDLVVLEGATVVMNPSVTGNDLSYVWTPNQYMNNNLIRNPIVTAINDVLYTITVTGTNNCVAKDDVLVSVLRPFKVPNTFTPNGDGVNDTWVIDKLSTYPGARVQVFNRYGQVVFESFGYPQPWNGTMQGKPVPFGTYYYIIEPGNGRKALTGYVTVLK